MNRECKINLKIGLSLRREVMALKETIQRLLHQIADIRHDLEKAMEGNKAAAQRARTNTIRFSKTSKVFRKESVAAARSGMKKAARAEKAKGTKKAPAKKKAPARKKKR